MYRPSLLLLMPALAALGCEDSEHPDTADVIGDYRATTLTSTDIRGASQDWLALGASISLTLNANKTTEGHLYIPPLDESDPVVSVDLAGTWDIVGGVIALNHEPNTFLCDIEFSFDGVRLTGQLPNPDASIYVVLAKWNSG